MSCYEWERGEFVLPSKEFSSFRKEMISAYNARQNSLFNAAKAGVEKLKAAIKGKRKLTYDQIFYIGRDLGISYEALNLIVKSVKTEKGYKVKVQAPKKKDLNLLPLTKDCTIDFGDASITFSKSGRMVYWDVMDNNHACDYARNHPLGGKFFNMLGRVNWTRGSGGKIVGNDEYNRDSYDEGGGGNYVKATYGPLGKKNSC